MQTGQTKGRKLEEVVKRNLNGEGPLKRKSRLTEKQTTNV